MAEEMQQVAVDICEEAMEKYTVEKDIAAYLKKEMDKRYGPTWHCVPFEDGDVRSFLEDFEDVAEAVGVKADRAKPVALRMLIKGRAEALLDEARKGPAKLQWATAKEALIAGSDTHADC
ncbi:dynein light chain LC8-type [Paragonimus westermani]|uniref:Dynein light chain n=1 Tax=Paragonimus westermani TaxID=34504 RepID=A0A5J4NNG8_9TREM|nr:dynein light chain LC8-type [Paragonimus westermani]